MMVAVPNRGSNLAFIEFGCCAEMKINLWEEEKGKNGRKKRMLKIYDAFFFTTCLFHFSSFFCFPSHLLFPLNDHWTIEVQMAIVEI